MDTAKALKELGRRLSQNRQQAGLDAASLSQRTGVPEQSILAFERGGGGLGVSALTRLASALGVAPTAFVHTSAPVQKATTEPTVLLKGSSVSASLSERDKEALAQGLKRALSFSLLGDVLRVEHLADAEPFQPKAPPARNAHKNGYDCADEVRKLLPERPAALKGLARLIENRFDILVLRHPFESPAVLGASCRSGRARLIAVSTRIEREPVQRFVLAHELGHHLLDLSESDVKTDEGRFETAHFWMENPPAEKRANAFAAMLLAPEKAVQNELGPPKPEGYGLTGARKLVTQASKAFGLSVPAMAWHLFNLRYLREKETVEALLTSPDEASLSGFEEETPFNGLERRAMDAYAHESISAARARELLGRPIEELITA